MTRMSHERMQSPYQHQQTRTKVGLRPNSLILLMRQIRATGMPASKTATVFPTSCTEVTPIQGDDDIAFGTLSQLHAQAQHTKVQPVRIESVLTGIRIVGGAFRATAHIAKIQKGLDPVLPIGTHAD